MVVNFYRCFKILIIQEVKGGISHQIYMKKYIESFMKNTIIEEIHEEQMIAYYGANETLLAELYFEEEKLSSVTFYHQELNTAVISREQLNAVILHVQQVFQKEDYVLYFILEGDDHYSVELTLQEPRFQLPVHGTGMNLQITKAGQIEDIYFLQDEVEIIYPDNMISKEEARQLLIEQPLMKKSILPDNNWQYGYAPTHEIMGIEVEGNVQFTKDLPEMKDAAFKELPEVERVADLQAFLLGGRACPLEVYERTDQTIWEVDDEDFNQAIEGNPFERACTALKTIVGDEYAHYYFVSLPNLYTALGLKDSAKEIVSYSFVYVLEESSFDFLAARISVHQETNQICSITLPFIPYEHLKRAPQPKISLEEANDLAKAIVDVELSLEREGFGSNRYRLVYSLDYPTSPTQGHIHFIDGRTGEIHFVETGF